MYLNLYDKYQQVLYENYFLANWWAFLNNDKYQQVLYENEFSADIKRLKQRDKYQQVLYEYASWLS